MQLPTLRERTMTFGDKLKALRQTAGLTQTDLAAKSGVSLGVIHDYEQGKKEPTLRSAVRLAAALGLSIEVLAECVTGERPKRGAGDGKGETGNGEGQPVRRRGRPKKKPTAGESSAEGPRKAGPS
ncbi:MAG: helix-turn-helix domain-containing protein [Gemmataceae bacterium]